jgi:hypothetical protein
MGYVNFLLENKLQFVRQYETLDMELEESTVLFMTRGYDEPFKIFFDLKDLGPVLCPLTIFSNSQLD